jgi:hypothetical protein
LFSFVADSVALASAAFPSEFDKEKETKMPFGLDLKSLILGVLIAWFVVPYVTTLLNRPQAQRAAA